MSNVGYVLSFVVGKLANYVDDLSCVVVNYYSLLFNGVIHVFVAEILITSLIRKFG